MRNTMYASGPVHRRSLILFAPAFAAALATPLSQASAQASVADIRRVADWARADGKPGPVAADLVPLIGLGPAPKDRIAAQHLTYRVADDADAGYQFTLLPIDGRLEMLVWRRTAGEMLVWRIDAAGRAIAAVRADASGARSVPVTDDAALFARTLAFFVARAPHR